MSVARAVGSGTTAAGGAATIEVTVTGSPRNQMATLKDIRFVSTDVSSDYTVTDAEGRTLFAKTAIDGTANVVHKVIALETATFDSAGEVVSSEVTDIGSSAPVSGLLPFSVAVANGGATLLHTVYATVEV